MKLLKKTSKFLISLAVVFTAASTCVFAQFSKEEMDKYKAAGETFHRFKESCDKPYLVPQTPFSKEVNEYIFGNLDDAQITKSGYTSEALFYVTKDTLIEKSKNQDKSKVDTSVNAVSKIVRSISKMKGMMYYSNTRKRYEVLYKEAYRIAAGTSSRTMSQVADDPEGKEGNTVYAMLDEHTFGKANYKIDYLKADKCVVMKMQNTTDLSYGIIKAVKPGDFKMAVMAVDAGDGYFFYVAMNVDFMSMSFLEEKMNRSFTARIRAVKDFIIEQF